MLSPKQLTAKIKQAKSVEEVLRVHTSGREAFDHIHIGACWNMLGKLAARQSGWLQRHAQAALMLCKDTRQVLPSADERALSNVAHGMAKARIPSRNEWAALFDAVAAEAAARGLGAFNPQELANTVWAYATAGHASPALFDAVAAEVAARGLGAFNPQNLANTVWAYVVANVPSEALFGGAHFGECCAAADFALEELCQLHQYALWLEERHLPWPPLPAELASRCATAFCAETAQPSQLQLQVADALRALGLDLQEEVRTTQGYSLDVVVCVEGRKVAVEVDGPSHFVGCTQKPTGATALKRRQLCTFGWELLVVPYWEWDGLPGRAEQLKYLQRQLGQDPWQEPLPDRSPVAAAEEQWQEVRPRRRRHTTDDGAVSSHKGGGGVSSRLRPGGVPSRCRPDGGGTHSSAPSTQQDTRLQRSA